MAELSKLARLRAKTDRDLVAIVTAELEIGLQLATIAANNDASGKRAQMKAEKAYAQALKLIPRTNLTEPDRQRLETGLKMLQAALTDAANFRAESEHEAAYAVTAAEAS